MPDTTNGRTRHREVIGDASGQQSAPEQRALEFLAKVVRVPGVRVNREEFLRQELRKLRMGDDAIARAIDSNPLLAGVALTEIDRLAEEAISYEMNKSAAISFVAGIPGGFAMLGTIPADLMQYYVHALRIMQKLAYLYGWGELLPDGRDADDDTLGVLTVFFGVMLGVGGAAQSLTAFARVAAKTAYQNHATKRALMSITWYPVVKHSLRLIGINITKRILEDRPRHRRIRVEWPHLHGAPVPIRAPQGAPARDPASGPQRRGVEPTSSGCVHKGADTRDSDEYQERPARQSEGRDGRRQERGLGHRRRRLQPLRGPEGAPRAPQVTTSPTRPGPGSRASAVPSPGLVTVYTPPLFALLTRPGEGKPATICG